MCKIIGMEVSCLCVPVAMPLLTAHKAWGVMGRRFQAAHSEETPELNQAPDRRATPVRRTSQPDCNIRPSPPFPLSIAPLLLQPRPITACQVASSAGAESQSLHPRLGGPTQLPASPFCDRFLPVKSRTRSKSHDYVRPIIGRSRTLACLPQLHSVSAFFLESCEPSVPAFYLESCEPSVSAFYLEPCAPSA